MRVLVTGARGFIGSALLPKLIFAGHDVTCVSRGSQPSEVCEKLRWFPVVASSQGSWDEIVAEKFDVIFHLGWSTVPKTAEEDPVADLIDNVATGVRLLTAIRQNSPQSRLVFTSSGG